MSTQLTVAVHDTHYPKTNLSALHALKSFLKDNKVDTFVFGGDQLDFECIAHHTKGKPLYRTENAYLRDIEGFDKNVLTPIEKLLTPKTKKVWIIGNHERFEHDLIEEDPQFKGLIDHVRLLKLRERGWEIVPLGHAYKLGKLNIIHGEVLTGIGNQAGAFPSKKAVEIYASSVLAGHTHAPQSFTRISPVNHTQKWMGWIAPTLCNTNPSYLRNRPTAWLNGVTIIESWGKGNFNLFPCVISKGKFAYGGRIYG